MLTRRAALAALASAAALPAMSGSKERIGRRRRLPPRQRPRDTDVQALLDELADNLLTLQPEKRNVARHRHGGAGGAASAADE